MVGGALCYISALGSDVKNGSLTPTSLCPTTPWPEGTGFRVLADSAPDIEVVGEASDGTEAVARLERLSLG
jgi:hypothetical protein